MQRSALCRSRRELSNEYQIDPNSDEYLLAKIGVDTAENELLEVLFNIIPYYSILFIRVLRIDAHVFMLMCRYATICYSRLGKGTDKVIPLPLHRISSSSFDLIHRTNARSGNTEYLVLTLKRSSFILLLVDC